MTKKIRFPLELADGTQARTLEDLQEHFDLESVLGYYKNGKLLTWLKDRYLESEAEAVEALDETAVDFQKQFCEVFGVEYRDHSVDLAEIERRQARMAKLRTYTDEKEFIDHIDLVAFDQEELADLLDEGQKKIYLCGDKFSVPVSQCGVHYIGVNLPVVHLSGKLPENLEEIEIVICGCEVENMPKTTPATAGKGCQEGIPVEEETELYTADGGSGIQDEETASLENTMAVIRDLEDELNQLAHIQVRVSTWISVDRSACDACAALDSESFPTKDRCRRAAEQRLEKAINDTQKKIDEKLRYSSDKSIYAAFKRNVECHVEDIKKLIKPLYNGGLSKTADSMMQYLKVSKFYEKAKQINNTLASQVSLYGISHYKSEIEYDSYDPSEFETGLSKLLAKSQIRYGFNCHEAVSKIERDAQKLLDELQSDFNNQIQDFILTTAVEPMQELLLKLRNKLEEN